MGINGLSRLQWSVLVSGCRSSPRAAALSPEVRGSERFRSRCGGGQAHKRASPPRSLPTVPARPTSRAFVVPGYRPRRHPVDGAGRGAQGRHGGGPTRGGDVTDLPLIKAAKLWAKVSQRTGATYLTGRWGGCRVLVFENLERASEAEPSHFLFLGEAGEWPVPDQAAASAAVAEPARELPEARAAPAVAVEAGAEEKPARRRRKARGTGAAEPPRTARQRREGWNGSVYRRPRDGAAATAEAGDGPFIEDPLDDLGRR